ncbi:MAG: hypothetical protein LQ340_003818 [Diploschistes diacapsis]|nr:MAG: hypothetical protein LQ340_003818 [Diploschistes diacapsis]
MQSALNILGYKCYHSLEIYTNLSESEMWGEALDAKFFEKGKPFGRREWDQLLGDYNAVSDVPAICFSEDLIEAYPEAKIILVERDIDKWYKSFNDTVVKYMDFRAVKYMVFLFNPPLLRYSTMTVKWVRGWMDAETQDELRAKAKDKYRKHYELVRRVTPKDRLLEFQVQEGWAPLCKFLGKPIPDVPFPYVNDTETLDERVAVISHLVMNDIKRKSLTALVASAFGTALVYYGARTLGLSS